MVLQDPELKDVIETLSKTRKFDTVIHFKNNLPLKICIEEKKSNEL